MLARTPYVPKPPLLLLGVRMMGRGADAAGGENGEGYWLGNMGMLREDTGDDASCTPAASAAPFLGGVTGMGTDTGMGDDGGAGTDECWSRLRFSFAAVEVAVAAEAAAAEAAAAAAAACLSLMRSSASTTRGLPEELGEGDDSRLDAPLLP